MHAISSYRGNRPTNTYRPTDRTDYNTLRRGFATHSVIKHKITRIQVTMSNVGFSFLVYCTEMECNDEHVKRHGRNIGYWFLHLAKTWSGPPTFGPRHASKVVGSWPMDRVEIDAQAVSRCGARPQTLLFYNTDKLVEDFVHQNYFRRSRMYLNTDRDLSR